MYSTVEKRKESSSFLFYFDKRDEVGLESMLNIFQTFFICLALAFGALAFSKDATDLVLKPVERMVEKVNRIKENPLNAVYLAD